MSPLAAAPAMLIFVALVLAAPADTASREPGSPATGPATRPGRADVPRGVTVVADLEFVAGGGPRQSLDLYLPPRGDKPAPLIIFIFGGGWGKGDKVTAKSPVLPLSEQGYAIAHINHRLSGQARFPAQIQDCKAAVRFLRANAARYHLAPDRFGVMGYSSGGHLSALLGTSGGSAEFEAIGGHADVSDKVQAVCDWYGPTDLLLMDLHAGQNSGIHHDGADSPESRLVGGPIQENREKAQRANPIRYITKDCPPFLILHGTEDRLVPVGQSELLDEALRKAGVDVVFQKVPGGGHGGSTFNRPPVMKLTQAFFDKHLRGAAVDVVPIDDPAAWTPPVKEKTR